MGRYTLLTRTQAPQMLVFCLLVLACAPLAHTQSSDDITALTYLLGDYPVLSTYGWSNVTIPTACTAPLFGVSCFAGNVSKLNLSDVALNGSFSIGFVFFSNLTELRLRNASLSGDLPYDFFYLTTTILDLSQNRLTSLPGVYIYNYNLPFTYLSLRDNQFSGDMSAIQYALNLQYLDLANNDFSGWITLQTINVLTHVDLSSNNFTGSVPVSLSSPSLHYLNLSNNPFLQLCNTNLIRVSWNLTGLTCQATQVAPYSCSCQASYGPCLLPTCSVLVTTTCDTSGIDQAGAICQDGMWVWTFPTLFGSASTILSSFTATSLVTTTLSGSTNKMEGTYNYFLGSLRIAASSSLTLYAYSYVDLDLTFMGGNAYLQNQETLTVYGNTLLQPTSEWLNVNGEVYLYGNLESHGALISMGQYVSSDVYGNALITDTTTFYSNGYAYFRKDVTVANSSVIHFDSDMYGYTYGSMILQNNAYLQLSDYADFYIYNNLTIESGAYLQFDVKYFYSSLYIYGSLLSSSTVNISIYLTANAGDNFYGPQQMTLFRVVGAVPTLNVVNVTSSPSACIKNLAFAGLTTSKDLNNVTTVTVTFDGTSDTSGSCCTYCYHPKSYAEAWAIPVGIIGFVFLVTIAAFIPWGSLRDWFCGLSCSSPAAPAPAVSAPPPPPVASSSASASSGGSAANSDDESITKNDGMDSVEEVEMTQFRNQHPDVILPKTAWTDGDGY